jgi:hypothetical protein
VPDLPDPAPAGSREKLLLEGMDPAKSWDYVLRAYVYASPKETILPAERK